MTVTAELPAILVEADVITVNLFGTVLVRNLCRHADLHRLTHEVFNASDRYLSEEFAPHRVEAEAAARRAASSEGRCAESVSYEVVYNGLADLMQLDAETTNRLAQAELEAEAAVLRPNPRGVRLVKLLADQGKLIVVLCSSYLPRTFLFDCFEATGISHLSALLAPTSDDTPLSGYDPCTVLAERFRGQSIVHIGRVADVEVACGHGMAVLDIPDAISDFRSQQGPAAVLNGPSVFQRLDLNGYRVRNVQRSMVNAIIAHRFTQLPTASEAYALGYGALGPMLAAFVQWLHRAALESACSRLCFSEPMEGLVASAYRSWWVDAGLPSTDTRDRAFRTGIVSLGWGNGGESPMSSPADSESAGQPDFNLFFGLSPERSPRLAATPLAAFIDGGRESQRPLYRELVAPFAPVLERLLSAPGNLEWAELQRGASDFVDAHRAAVAGLPTTVAILDGPTACENMAGALSSPTPAAARILGLWHR